MFKELIINCEGAIAFDQKEVSKIHKDVSLPILIKIIKHKAQQEKNFLCLKALIPVIIKMLLKRLKQRVLEKCNGLYKNPQFLVTKKLAGTYKLINAAIKMNLITLQDINMPLSIDEFSEEFAKY